MKLPLFSGILSLCLLPMFALSQDAEEAAIKAVIQQETEDFTRLPFAEVAKKYWILDEKTFICASDGEGHISFVQKDDMLANNEIAPDQKTVVEKTDYKIVINGNMASVYHHQVVNMVEMNFKLFSHEVRIMEKVDGAWKIHCSTVQHYVPQE